MEIEDYNGIRDQANLLSEMSNALSKTMEGVKDETTDEEVARSFLEVIDQEDALYTYSAATEYYFLRCGYGYDSDDDDDRCMLSALRDGDVHKFVYLMERYVPDTFATNRERKPILCKVILAYALDYGAVDCITALVEGRVPGVCVDLNSPFIDMLCPPYSGRYPLHVAASNFDYGLVDLFLRYGARTDVGIVKNGIQNKSLPLNVALESFYCENLVDWTPEESLFMLVATLCLPRMRRALKTTRLLAVNTEGVNDIFRYYAKNGQLIEMAVLLVVAYEKIIVEGIMSARESINQEIVLVVHAQIKTMLFSGEWSKQSKVSDAKWETLKSALLLLQVFDMAGDALHLYLQSEVTNVMEERVVKDVATIFKEAGIMSRDEDIDLSNIDWVSSNGENCKINEAMGQLEKIRAYHCLHRGKQLGASTVWPLMGGKQMPWRVRMPCLRAHEMQKRHVPSSRASYSVQSSHFRAQSNGGKNPIAQTLLPFRRGGNVLAFLPF